MMKKYYLFGLLLIASGGQNVSSQNRIKKTSFDSIPDIKIDKLIFYQEPILIHRGEFAASEYKPIWYETQHMTSDCEDIKPELAINFYQKRIGITQQDLTNSIKDTTARKEKNAYYDKWPNDYKFGEVCLLLNQQEKKLYLYLIR